MFKWEKLDELRASMHQPHQREVLWYTSHLAFNFTPLQDSAYIPRQNAARVALACAMLLALDHRVDVETHEIVPLSEDDRQTLLNKVVSHHHNLITHVQRLTVNNLTTGSNTWQYDAMILTMSLASYDLLAAMDHGETILAPARARLIEYLANFYGAAADTVEGVGPITFLDFVKNNHALKVAGALGLGAVVLGEYDDPDPYRQPRRWLETALYVIDNVLWRDPYRQSEPDRIAGYAEGPYYFTYAFINCLPFIRALKHYWPYDDSLHAEFRGAARRVRHPYFDPVYDRLYEWLVRTCMPDGRIVPIDDSFLDKTTLILAALEKPRYHIPVDFSGFFPSQTWSYGHVMSSPLDFGPFYFCANTPFSDFSDRRKNECFPTAGNAVFRSDFSSQATYLHVTAENGRARIQGAGHNQGDVSSFIICKNAEILALDPGYVSWNQRNLVGNADNHNLILSGNCGPAIGTPLNPNDADGFLNDFVDLPRLAAVEASTRYCSTDVRRDFVFVGEKAVFVYDYVDRGAPTHFRWQLHGNGREGGTTNEGTFEWAEQGGVWRRPRAGLRLHIQSPETCSLSTRLSPHEFAFTQTADHTVLEARVNNQSRASFLAALVPFDAGMETPVVSTLSVSGASACVFDDYVAFGQTQKSQRTITLADGSTVVSDALFFIFGDSTFLFRTGQDGGFFDGPFFVHRDNAGKTA
ncbi:MAG: heparinase II/III family protein, partial [Bacteroidia bacterium]|nr:heparinase II/III family protein [Bacteroidia bacterium]